jgi:hypothetical protein
VEVDEVLSTSDYGLRDLASVFESYPVWVWQQRSDRIPVGAITPDGELSPAEFDRVFTRSSLWAPLPRLGQDALFASRSARPTRRVAPRRARWVLPVSILEVREPIGPLASGEWFVYQTTPTHPRLIAVLSDGSRIANRQEMAARVLAWHRRHGRVSVSNPAAPAEA